MSKSTVVRFGYVLPREVDERIDAVIKSACDKAQVYAGQQRSDDAIAAGALSVLINGLLQGPIKEYMIREFWGNRKIEGE